MPEPAYRDGRRAVLNRFLLRPRIFVTDTMVALLEAAARENIEDELESLGPGAPQ